MMKEDQVVAKDDNNAHLVDSEEEWASKEELVQIQKHNELIQEIMTADVTKKFKSYQFVKLIQTKEILDDVTHKLYERDPLRFGGKDGGRNLANLRHALKHCDKELFYKYREGVLTFD